MTSSPEVHTRVWTKPPSPGVGHRAVGLRSNRSSQSPPLENRLRPTIPDSGAKGIQLGSGQSANRTRNCSKPQSQAREQEDPTRK
eukprot:12937433-Alexandrium_andersonii.AAC.1